MCGDPSGVPSQPPSPCRDDRQSSFPVEQIVVRGDLTAGHLPECGQCSPIVVAMENRVAPTTGWFVRRAHQRSVNRVEHGTGAPSQGGIRRIVGRVCSAHPLLRLCRKRAGGSCAFPRSHENKAGCSTWARCFLQAEQGLVLSYGEKYRGKINRQSSTLKDSHENRSLKTLGDDPGFMTAF